MEEGCVTEKIRRTNIPAFNDVREYVLKICSSNVGIPKGVRRKYVFIYTTKVDKICNYLRKALLSNLEVLRKLPIEGFYLEIVRLAGINDYVECVNSLYGKLRVIDRLSNHYKVKVKSSLDVKEARTLFREYVGRVLSIVRRSEDELNMVREAVKTLSKTPCFEDLPTIVVAGMPQTGKSTLVGRISSAKPKVSSFPFATKDVILGHTVVGGVKLQIVDTPGILDRPISELNVIEQKAYVAIKYLADLILFLIDPLETYYSLQSQLNLLSNVVKEFGTNKVLVLVNKIDTASPEKIAYVKELIRREFKEITLYCVSALHGIGLQEVINDALRHLGLVNRSPKFYGVKS